MSEEPVLVTGAAGFIGFHVARRLLQSGRAVVGLGVGDHAAAVQMSDVAAAGAIALYELSRLH